MNDAGQGTLDARNEAFRRLGRNVYLMQLIEHQLKHLVVNTAMDGHPEELERKQAAKKKRARKASMGTLMNQFCSAVFTDNGAGSAEPVDPTKPWFSFSYRIEADEQFVQQRRKELRRLVKERNKLIHTVAADIRPDDTDKWIALGAFLDIQRVDLVSEHEKLQRLLKNLSEMAKHSAQFIETQLLGAESNLPGTGS